MYYYNDKNYLLIQDDTVFLKEDKENYYLARRAGTANLDLNDLAALNRLIALAKMVHHPSLGILTRRREFNLRGIEEHMLTRGPESAVGGQEQVSASTAQPL